MTSDLSGIQLHAHLHLQVRRPDNKADPSPPARESRPDAPAEDHYTSAPAEQPADYRGVLIERQFGVAYTELRDLVAGFLQRQGVEAGHLEDVAQEEAQAAIAEDGYWGVEQTAERIFQFAVNAAGNDTTRLEKLRAAVAKGYEQAKGALGGWLPEVSERTVERVYEKFDAWAEQADSPTAST